jgi:hypothetical protein
MLHNLLCRCSLAVLATWCVMYAKCQPGNPDHTVSWDTLSRLLCFCSDLHCCSPANATTRTGYHNEQEEEDATMDGCFPVSANPQTSFSVWRQEPRLLLPVQAKGLQISWSLWCKSCSYNLWCVILCNVGWDLTCRVLLVNVNTEQLMSRMPPTSLMDAYTWG